MNIPQKLWHIWIGPHQAPLLWMNSWPEKHPDWEYKIFDNRALTETQFYNQHLIDEYLRREKYNGVADLVRYELLLQYGGFVPPADAVCFENTNELWVSPRGTCYTVYENETIRPGYVSPIYACNPGNQFVRLIVETLHQLEPSSLSDRVWESTGNLFLANMIAQHSPEIRIFPSHYFIPKHFKAKTPRYSGPDKVYADQMWGTTRKQYHEGTIQE